MSGQKVGAILNSVLDILKIIKSSPVNSQNEESRINEIADMAIGAAGASVRHTANQVGRPDPSDTIAAHSYSIGSDIRKFLNSLFKIARTSPAEPRAVRETGFQFKEFLSNQFAESPTVKIISDIGKIIGQKLGIPLGSYIGQGIGYMVAAITESLVKTCGLGNHHQKLIMNTEFTVEMLQRLQEYGLTEQNLTLLTKKFTEECNELDISFSELQKRNQEATSRLKKSLNKLDGKF